MNGIAENKRIGLEIPAMFTFHHRKESKIPKLRELLNGSKEDKRLRTQYHFRIPLYKAVDKNFRDYSLDVMLLYFSFA